MDTSRIKSTKRQDFERDGPAVCSLILAIFLYLAKKQFCIFLIKGQTPPPFKTIFKHINRKAIHKGDKEEILKIVMMMTVNDIASNHCIVYYANVEYSYL